MKSGGRQRLLDATDEFAPGYSDRSASTFAANMRLPVHRWFRFSAGFSAAWAESVIRAHAERNATVVLDPFAGSGTTLLAAENAGVESHGVEAHPFLARVARAKLLRCSDPVKYRKAIARIRRIAGSRTPDLDQYPSLIRNCYDDIALSQLDLLHQAVSATHDGAAASELAWLTLVGILRRVSHANTAQWQYVLPKKRKQRAEKPAEAFEQFSDVVARDMRLSQNTAGPPSVLLETDARTCHGVPRARVNLVVTSPPYPNNYDYADATRLEMSFLREIEGWGDLHGAVRHRLIRSCSQHVPEKAVDLESVLSNELLAPIERDIRRVCEELAKVRLSKGGKKTYHLMVACYFLDLASVWRALRSVCAAPSDVCFVIGDSAPYGVYVPVIEWLGKLALAAGFESFRFERTRDRNVKWKNRKHTVPLCEGRLWVQG